MINSLANQNMDRLVEDMARYLYSQPATHNMMAVESENKCDSFFKHQFKFKENRYGDALFIVRYCTSCGSCYGEVFPPRGKPC